MSASVHAGVDFVDLMDVAPNPRLPSKRVSVASLTAKVLCKRHNEMLSDLDAEAGKLSSGILGAFETLLAGKSVRNATLELSGAKLERWCLKTIYNFYASGWIRMARTKPFAPQRPMLDVIFGHATLPPRAGLYVIERPGNLPRLRDLGRWSVRTIDMREQDEPIGVYISFRGFGMLLWMNTALDPNMFFYGRRWPVENPAHDPNVELEFHNCRFLYRPRETVIVFGEPEPDSKLPILLNY